MLTDYLNCYKLTNKTSIPLQRREKFSRTLRLSNFLCNQSFGVLKHQCLIISKRKKLFLNFKNAFRKQLILLYQFSGVYTELLRMSGVASPEFCFYENINFFSGFLLFHSFTNISISALLFKKKRIIYYLMIVLSTLQARFGLQQFVIIHCMFVIIHCMLNCLKIS